MSSAMKVVVVAVLVALGLGVLVVRHVEVASSPRKSAPPATAGNARVLPEGLAGPASQEGATPNAAIAQGLRLDGQVVDPLYNPIGGAEVTINTEPARTTTAEEDGSFYFAGLAEGPYTIVARSHDQVGMQAVRLAAKSEPTIVIVDTGALLAVEVRAANAGPLADAEVEVTDGMSTVARTDVSGHVQVSGLPAGLASISVRAPGYVVFRQSIVLAAGSSEPTRLRVDMKQGATVRGRVVNPSGTPVAGAAVQVVPADSSLAGFPGELVARSDEEGRFSLQGVSPGTALVSATHDGFAPADAQSVNVPAEGTSPELQVVLKDGVQVSGTVVGTDGAPVAGATVTAFVARAFQKPLVLGTVASGADGSFAFRQLPRRQVTFIAELGAVSSEEVTILPGEGPSPALHLAAGAQIAGYVIDNHGVGVARARVLAVPEKLDKPGALASRTGWRIESTDEGGHFELKDLPPGQYRVRADWAETKNQERMLLRPGLVVRTGDANVRISLASQALLRGQVAFADGSHPAMFTIRLGQSAAVPFAVASGRFEVDEVPSGKVWVRVSGPAFETVTLRDIEVPPAGVKNLGTITVKHGRRVRGLVVDEAGRPVAGVRVVNGGLIVGTGTEILADQSQADIAGLRSAETGSYGRFEIPGLEPGVSVLVAEHPQLGRTESHLLPGGDRDVELRLTLRPVAALSGTLMGAAGPMADQMVVASPKGVGNVRFAVRTDAKGDYRFDRLAPGDYVVTGYYATGRVNCGIHAAAHLVSAELQLALQVPTGGRALKVSVASKTKNRVAMVYVIPGAASPTAASEAEAAAQGAESGISCAGAAKEALPLETPYPPGDEATACALAIPVDRDDPNQALRVRDQLDRLPIICQRIPARTPNVVIQLP